MRIDLWPASVRAALLWACACVHASLTAHLATPPIRRRATPWLLAGAFCLAAGADPALAQYSLGTSTTPFTAPGQTITLSYYLGNATSTDATVTSTLGGQIGSPSCADPVLVAANTTKTCTFTYNTSLTDVATNAITVNSQWSFCDTSGCNAVYTYNNVLTVKYRGAPVITGAVLAVPFNSPGTGVDLSSNITGAYLYLSVASPPAHGMVTINGTLVTYIPAAGYYGPDSFSYTATGPNGTSAPAIINATVALPPAPTAAAASANVVYNSPGTAIDLTSKITGVATSIAFGSAPSHGSVTLSGKLVTYTPNSGYIGTDNFTYTAAGPGGTSAPATVNLTINAPLPPSTAPTSVAVPYNSAGMPIDLASKITGVATSISATSSPSHGTVSVGGMVTTYTPTAGFYGPDSFTYTATGPGGTSAPATVSLTVAPPAAPIAGTASATVANNSPGTPIDVTARINGLATSITISTSPTHGTVSISGLVATYTPAANYSGADSFAYTATGPGGISAPATVNITVSPPIVTNGTITIKLATLGRDGSFTFVSTIPAAATFSLTSTGGTATKTMTGIAAGTYAITQAGLPSGFQVQSVQCNGAAATGSTASVTLTNGGAVVCIFTNTALQASQQATSDAVRSFMRNRANTLASSEPDAGRRHARVMAGDDDGDPAVPPSPRAPVSGPGAGGAPINGTLQGAGRFAQGALSTNSEITRASAANVSGNVQDGNGQLSFSTSLSQMRQAARDNETARRMALGGTPYTTPASPARPVMFDVWIEAHTSMYADNTAGGNRRGNVDLVFLGADYLVSKSVLVGALVQFDRARESSSVLGTSAEGTGWMAGPYLTARLGRNVLFDARAAWGQSSNSVSVATNMFGSTSDAFATSRALMSAKLSGNWVSGALRFTPAIDVTYFQEQQKAFTSASGAFVPDQTVALGRLSAGPEFGYKIATSDGGVFEPYASLKALWDFKRDATVSVGVMDVGTDAVRGKAEAGASFTSPSGVAIKGAASYDGLGDKNFHAVEGKLSVYIPLQ